MSDIQTGGMECSLMSETPHGTINGSNGDSGYLTLTPRSGGFTPVVGESRSRTSLLSGKRTYRLRDTRQSAPRLRSKFTYLLNSEQGFDSLVDESHEGISQDSGNFSCEHASLQNERTFSQRDSQETRDIAAELRERRSRNRRAWRSAAPVTPASRLQLLSPPPSPAVPSTSFVASEPMDEDVDMKLVAVSQSTPYLGNSPKSLVRHATESLNFSPAKSRKIESVDNKKLSKLVITDYNCPIVDIKPKRLDFSQRIVPCDVRKGRATPDFTGKETVDVITLLGEKSNHWRVVSKILSLLAPQDLCSFSMVSKAWRRICNNDSRANMRRLSHIILRQNTKENLKFLRKAKLESAISTSPKSRFVRKGYLQEVQNFLHSPRLRLPPNSPPVSPSKIKFHSFIKASRTLEPWEHLLPCPSCSFPCHVDDEKKVGKCSRQGCSMEFCSSCSSRPHAGPCKTPLLATPTKRNKRSLVVGSRQSKRNLRRL